MQCSESVKPVKAVDVWPKKKNESVTWHCECYKIILLNINKHLGMRKAVGFSPTLTTLGRLFRAAAFTLSCLAAVASCQNSRWRLAKTQFVHYFSLSISCRVFPSKFRSPVRRHCWKEHCWKELLERALLEGAVGKSYWKEPALSRDWRKFWSLCECIGHHYIWRSGRDQRLSADRSVESPGRWKWRASNFVCYYFFFACVLVFFCCVSCAIVYYLFSIRREPRSSWNRWTDQTTMFGLGRLGRQHDAPPDAVMVRVRALEWSPLVLEML